MTRSATVLALLALVLTALGAPAPASAAGSGPTAAPGAAASAAGPHAARTGRATVARLSGVRVRLRPGTRQVVTVNRTRGHHARIAYWVKDRRWHRVLVARDGRIGYGGLVPAHRRRQGTGTTPLGTFALPSAFGMHRRSANWDLPYRKVRAGDYWVQDNASAHYNRYRNKRAGGFRWWLPSSHPDSSERLLDYRSQYEWAVVMRFNPGQVRHRGSGIFLHVNGSGATAGCVSAPRWFVKRLMRRLDPDRRPVVAVGR